ncbi:hypothetical protein AUJ14_06340 [Candidatus Micrarchaeota archaeon CG1_02_55_22]|nr:MAG: hypothetical protein AUJ14_06340 [Candidatus Micrarchaeota archaeon CG1_02_55_22]
MVEVFDVAVIGAGPAGGSAALHAAKLGLKVLVLEEHAVVGEPVHCGECLSLLAVQRMGFDLPASAVSSEAKGIRVVFPQGKSVLVTEPGFVLEKHKFEQWIIAQAQSAGAKVILGGRVTAASRADGMWTLKAGGKEYSAKLLIDATGIQSFSSTVLKLNARYASVVGVQYELQDIPRDGYIDFYIWPELAPHGYLWMIPKSGGRANVGLVTNENNNAKKYLDEFVKRMGWSGKVVNKTFGGLIPASGPSPVTFSDGLLLVGDAAGFTSPLFEGGTQLGLMSGKFAAQIAKRAVELNDYSKQSLSEYERLWKKEFPDYAPLVKGKDSLYALSDDELVAMVSTFPSELGTLSAADKAVVGAKLLATQPGLLFTKNLFSVFEAFKYSRAQYYGW